MNASEDNTSRRRGRRRAKGEGSFWQRKDGRWAFAGYALTTGGTYKRVQGYGRDQADVRVKLNRLLADSDRGIPIASGNWMVAEYLGYWLEHVVLAEGRPNLGSHHRLQFEERLDTFSNWKDHGLAFLPKAGSPGAGQPAPELGTAAAGSRPGGCASTTCGTRA